jgi:hypothetical protein
VTLFALQETSNVTGTLYLTDGSELENAGTLIQGDNSNFYNEDGNTGNMRGAGLPPGRRPARFSPSPCRLARWGPDRIDDYCL